MINWIDITCMFIGGLAFFLWGMTQMVRYIKVVGGSSMKKAIAKATGNRFMGVLTGCGVTCLNNSSSITTVIMIGFISSGMMTLQQSVGVILGADIGSTITAQLIAFNMFNVAMVMFTIGTVMWSFDWKIPYAKILMGLSVIFVGMWLMKTGMNPLRSYQPFLDLMTATNSVIVSVAIGAVFTAIIQSSAATTGIVIVMASQGLLSLEASIALTLGANIGTCATALLAAIGKPREAVRAAILHILFKIIGVAAWLALVPQLAQFAMWTSDEIGRQIANAHTFFNIANTVMLIGFANIFVRFVETVVPLSWDEKEDRDLDETDYEVDE